MYESSINVQQVLSHGGQTERFISRLKNEVTIFRISGVKVCGAWSLFRVCIYSHNASKL